MHKSLVVKAKPMTIYSRVFTLEVDGRATLTFEAGSAREAQGLCKEVWLRDDLDELMSDGVQVYTPAARLSTRPANAEETVVFTNIAGIAEPSDELLLVYLIELDGPPSH
jgi:hypothetical protein